MPKLLNRFELAKELQTIIENTSEYLILISPYFKLNEELKRALSKLKLNTNLELIIVYGKNEEDKRKSLSDEDMAFFKSFSNIEIRYHKRLHAKIYTNEDKCLITSLNLHDYSLKENIEVGILTKSKRLDSLINLANTVSKNLLPESLDIQAYEFAQYIIEKSTIEYKKEIKKEKYLFGLFTTIKGSEVSVDKPRNGFCIRTKRAIPFNLARPYSKEAFDSWQQYQNRNYREKYCHGCGNAFQTTMADPLCVECNRN